ncbi:hypothetical protein O6H91_10G030600 [Diphasiastrum complanatum]|uniref:Uncharacterized protein n=2 Tax=Diphasiastrum complanatum TaxID=34168 RepID=A0ACC2CFI8_DIPCM|nr:hypothetical protein O6H91_10G030600 [Diphasiastrum complanatum]
MDRCRFKDQDSTKWPESESLSQDNQPFTFSGATSMDPETFDNKVYDYESTTSSDLDVASLRLVPGDGHRIRRRYADDRAFGGGEEDIDAGLFQRHDEASCATVRFHRRRMKSRNSTVRIAPSADLMNHCKNVVTRAKGSRNDCLNSSFEPYNQEIIERRTALNSSTYNSTDNYATSEELEPQIKVCTANSSAQTLNSNCITKNTVQKVPFRFKNRVVDCSKEEIEDNRMTWESGHFQSANRASSTVRRKSLHHRTKAHRRKTSQMQLPTGLQGKVKDSIPEVILSQNPYKDFRHSMISMILEKDLKRTTDLEELLQCYISLNAPYFSSLIIQAFSELWFQIFGDRS